MIAGVTDRCRIGDQFSNQTTLIVMGKQKYRGIEESVGYAVICDSARAVSLVRP